MKINEHEQDLETISKDNIQSNNVVINVNKNSSHDSNISVEESYDYLTSGSDSDDNMVYGTPNKSLVVS